MQNLDTGQSHLAAGRKEVAGVSANRLQALVGHASRGQKPAVANEAVCCSCATGSEPASLLCPQPNRDCGPNPALLSGPTHTGR